MVITRFAPSPTGRLHLGSARTALFNWLWARKTGGQFILRIDDTDQQRLVPKAAEQILTDLHWLGLDWDWGPDRPHPDWGPTTQSERLANYQQVAELLLERDLAYRDQTTPSELEQLRRQAQKERRPFIFRRSLARYQPAGDQPTVIRLAIPDDLTISWTDQVKGQQQWSGRDIGDFVILKSDGWPTYQLASLVDDQAMGVSHIIRADEWLSSTPKHLYLIDQLDYNRPICAHVPPVMSPTGNKKLSKRTDEGVTIDDLRQAGYPPAALLNYLALLGWNPGSDQEIFSPAELVKLFDPDRIQTSGARFDPRRLDWMSGHHIRLQDPGGRLETARDWWPASADKFSDDYRQGVLGLVFERLKKWSELAGATDFFFADPEPWTNEAITAETKVDAQEIEAIVSRTRQLLDETADQIEAGLRALANQSNLKPTQVFMVVRIKLAGQTKTPNLLDVIDQLGLDVCRCRLTSPL